MRVLFHASERFPEVLQHVLREKYQGQAAPKPKQAATQRRDGDGAACPQFVQYTD
jgi:hypothetical protein